MSLKIPEPNGPAYRSAYVEWLRVLEGKGSPILIARVANFLVRECISDLAQVTPDMEGLAADTSNFGRKAWLLLAELAGLPERSPGDKPSVRNAIALLKGLGFTVTRPGDGP